MNTINRSTGFTPFQLHFSKSPRILPPILDDNPDNNPTKDTVQKQIARMLPLELEA
jgi:hypothetical protein